MIEWVISASIILILIWIGIAFCIEHDYYENEFEDLDFLQKIARITIIVFIVLIVIVILFGLIALTHKLIFGG